MSILLTLAFIPPLKVCDYEIRANHTSPSLTKFIVNSIHIYVSKSVYYKNIFHN
jgi:hypothetical protein